MSDDLSDVYDFLAGPDEPCRWGPWRLNPRALTLECRQYGRLVYDIDLERCRTSAQVLDWYHQIAGKDWGRRPEVLAGLVLAIDDVLYPQQHLCTFGNEHTMPPGVLAERVERAADKWPEMVVGE